MSELPVSLEGPRWRPMKHDDLPAVSALAHEIHASYPEDEAVFQDKLQLFPYGCFALTGGDSIVGYCFSHPWEREVLPPLNTMIGKLPLQPSAYLVHDIAISEDYRRHGAARRLMTLLQVAAKLFRVEHITLISVNGTVEFWNRNGFVRTDNHYLQQVVRQKYSEEAVHMEASIGKYF